MDLEIRHLRASSKLCGFGAAENLIKIQDEMCWLPGRRSTGWKFLPCDAAGANSPSERKLHSKNILPAASMPTPPLEKNYSCLKPAVHC